MRVLICGSRDWDNRTAIFTVLGGLLEEAMVNFDILTVIQGEARGADTIAGQFYSGRPAPGGGSYAEHDYVVHERYRADWAEHGKAAGPIRNQHMLDEGKPDVVWAFVTKPLKESRGTHDMVKRARAAGIPVYVVTQQ